MVVAKDGEELSSDWLNCRGWMRPYSFILTQGHAMPLRGRWAIFFLVGFSWFYAGIIAVEAFPGWLEANNICVNRVWHW